MITEISQKIAQFNCKTCDYITNNKFDYNKHLLTLKHINNNNDNENSQKLAKIAKTICVCGKEYKYASGLSAHKKKCIEIVKSQKIEMPSTKEETIISDISTNLHEILKQNNEFKQIVVEQNKLIIEQSQKILELSSKNSVVNTNSNSNNTNNLTNSNNTKFNLNFFLNEQCKDALNISEFINSLKLQVSDLENTGKLGFAEGISQIIIKGLKDLDIYKRPIHCSDLKRETMYVKDQDIWEKEDTEKEKLKKTIDKIAYKNIKQISSWVDLHPNCTESSSKDNDLYLNIVNESMGGIDKEESNKYYEKIVKNVSKEVSI
jgi:hypothetical protein